MRAASYVCSTLCFSCLNKTVCRLGQHAAAAAALGTLSTTAGAWRRHAVTQALTAVNLTVLLLSESPDTDAFGARGGDGDGRGVHRGEVVLSTGMIVLLLDSLLRAASALHALPRPAAQDGQSPQHEIGGGVGADGRCEELEEMRAIQGLVDAAARVVDALEQGVWGTGVELFGQPLNQRRLFACSRSACVCVCVCVCE